MNVTVETNVTIPFERFWRWLREHYNCIVEAGTPAVAIFDFEDFHWAFSQDEEGRVIVQMVRGKNLVGELVIDPSEVLFVQASPDAESASQGQWLFEVTGGTREEPYVAAYFVINHAFEDLSKHEALKH